MKQPGTRSMLANGQRCRQNADLPRSTTTDPARTRTRRPTARPSPSLAQAPCPTPPTPPQLGIGPDARPERKKPNLSAELSACTTMNFLWLPDLGSNQGPTD